MGKLITLTVRAKISNDGKTITTVTETSRPASLKEIKSISEAVIKETSDKEKAAKEQIKAGRKQSTALRLEANKKPVQYKAAKKSSPTPPKAKDPVKDPSGAEKGKAETSKTPQK